MKRTRTVCSRALLYSSAAVVCLVTGRSAAVAQGTGQLETIIVTAQKRSEPLQKTPISVAAITASSASAKGITGTSDLAVAVPGVSVDNLLFASNPSMRGISQTNVTPGDETATSIYVDGVYMTTPLAGILSFNNIERVEVLKGPQGTLFGRNAAAGVINIITKAPSHTPSLDASIGYGNYSTLEGKFYGTAGLTNNLAADIAVFWEEQQDGWGRNLVTGSDNFKGYDFAARSKWSLDLGPDTNVTMAVDYAKRKSNVGISQHFPEGSLGSDGVTRYAGFFNTTENLPSYVRLEQWGVNLQLRHDLGWANLVNIASYRNLHFRGAQDQDITPLPITNLQLTIPTKSVTEEFQILAPDDSKIKWIGGLFYLHSESGFLPLGISGTGVPAGFQLKANAKTESYSAFAQATAPVPLMPDTNLTLGVRFTEDKQSITGGNFIGNTPAGVQASASKKFPKLTYKATLDHSFTDDLLGYVTFSRGFKSGIFNTASPNNPAVNPMVVDALEVGVKSEWFNKRLRLNAAAFSYQIKDVQLTRVSTLGVATLFNAAGEHSRGFDVDMQVVPIENLTLTSGLAYTYAFYSSFPGAPLFTPKPTGGNCSTCFFDGTGQTALETPRWSANFGAQYVIRSERGDVAIGANYGYVGHVFWSPDHRLRRQGYNMVNSTVTWTSPNGMWDVRVWGKNLLDERIYAFMVESALADKGSPAAPLTYGISLGVHLN